MKCFYDVVISAQGSVATRKSKSLRYAFAAAIGAACSTIFAATIDPAEYQALVIKANNEHYVSVLISLNVDAPLSLSAERRKENARNIASAGSALIARLGQNVVAATAWSNGLGQMAFRVTSEGLAQLAGSTDVKRLEADIARVNVYDPDGQFQKIYEHIGRNGSATVSVVPNLDNLEWVLGANGDAVFPWTQELATEYREKAPAFVNSLSAQAVQNIDQIRSKLAGGLPRSSAGNAAPQIELVVTLEGFLHLISRTDVRTLRMPELEVTQPAELDSKALDAARRDGSAKVAINLRTPAGYSPNGGYMSKRAWAAQASSLRAAVNEIITAVSPEALPTLFQGEGLPGGFVVLPFDALRRLFDHPDPRIKSIQLDEPIGFTSLNISTGDGPGGVNAQRLWYVNNIRGAGQWVAILDTGTQRSHAMFVSKYAGEGCYGTNSSEWMSVCPSPDANGASVPGTAGAASPCGDYVFPTPTYLPSSQCRHGTAVAGAATGNSNGYGYNGVAIAADLFLVNIFSQNKYYFDSTTFEKKRQAFPGDMARGLNLIASLTPSFPDITVNMSLSTFDAFYASNCDTVSPQVTAAISLLKSLRVATVIPTGNRSKRTAIGFPACITGVIKVAASDKQTGDLWPESNTAPESTFFGPIFVAPGSNIYTSIPGGGMDYLSGTSLAAPHVAGAYALVKSVFPGIGVDDISAYYQGQASVPIAIPVTAPIAPYNLRRIRMPSY